jgi:hypothetical protein
LLLQPGFRVFLPVVVAREDPPLLARRGETRKAAISISHVVRKAPISQVSKDCVCG